VACGKSPEALIALFDRNISAEPTIERRKNLRWPAAFVNGNVFAGLFQDTFIPSRRRVIQLDNAASPPRGDLGRRTLTAGVTLPSVFPAPYLSR
jgi:hypothetical protein